jgi:hypothetical protein
MFGWFRKKYHYRVFFDYINPGWKQPGYTYSTMNIIVDKDSWVDEVDIPNSINFLEKTLNLMGIKPDGLHMKKICRERCYCERS